MIKKLTDLFSDKALVFLLLAIIFFSAIFSLKDDSVTADEVVHIVAGYSYLTQKDYRLNPEHPPLIKDLAAIPLLFLKPGFPHQYFESPIWAVQSWNFGIEFLYGLNNPEKILFFSRLIMVFLLIFLACFLFYWTKELAGKRAALFVLFLFSFSPNFLAHGRLVTTDVGATLGVVLATYFYLKFLKNPNRKNIIFSGLTLAIALLMKFSTILLLPFFGIITLIFFWLKIADKKKVLNYLKSIFLIGIIAILIIWFIYQFHLLNYPTEKQLEEAKFILSRLSKMEFLNEISLAMIKNPLFRPLGQYLLGLSLAISRTFSVPYWPVYFLGTVSNRGFWYYFPIVYLIKVPLAFHFLTLISLLVGFRFLREISIKKWLGEHLSEFSMMIFLTIYWLVAISGKVNIGIRHLLPIFPFNYILVSLGINHWLEKIKILRFKKIALSLIFFLLFWYSISSLSSFPHYLSYFNELVGGSKKGYEYVVDSNCDWGQDLKRLAKWVNSQGIEKIYVDYFPGDPEGNKKIIKYYLGEKAIPWLGSCWWRYWDVPPPGEFPQKNYLAVSNTFLQTDQGLPRSDYRGYWGCYNWLNDYQPITQIGNSILVYYIYD